MRRKATFGVAVLVATFIAIQFIPVHRSNPPIEADVGAPSEVKDVLERSCYDCHSNETRWPWYSRVAPISWLVAWDVREGREALNFSTWNRLSTHEQVEMLEESWEVVDEGEMPLWYYLPAHPEARIRAQDRAVLRAWAAEGTAEHSPSEE